MDVIEILPRLWISNTNDIPKNKNFFINNNIRYVINLTYDIPNYFTNVTYFNIPINEENLDSNIVMSIEQLFDVVNKFIVQGYNHGIGILIHDTTGNEPAKAGKLSLMFACAFIISKLKITFNDVIEYLKLHQYNHIDYIIKNNFLINYEKKFDNKRCT